MIKLHPELELLRLAMDGEGRPEDYHTIVFYGPGVAHKVNFDVNVFHARYMISNLDRAHPEYGWGLILANGTLEDAVTTLESYRPFLPWDKIDEVWHDALRIAPDGSGYSGFANWH